MFCPSMVGVTSHATARFYGRVRAPVYLIYRSAFEFDTFDNRGVISRSIAFDISTVITPATAPTSRGVIIISLDNNNALVRNGKR